MPDGFVAQPPPSLTRLLRLLPAKMRGKSRLARLLLGSRLTQGPFLIEGAAGSKFLLPNAEETVGFHMLISGIYEPDEVNWVLDRLHPGDTFVDVGANIGLYTVMAAQRVGPTGRVVAIEASRDVFPYLAHNVALNNLTNVSLFEMAADSTASDNRVFFKAPMDRFGSGTMTPEFGGSPIDVVARPLDTILAEAGIAGPVRVMKVDVEGFEDRVFAGAKNLLDSDEGPDVIFEFYDWAEREAAAPGSAQRRLVEFGYAIGRLDANGHEEPLTDILTSGGATLVAGRRRQ